MTPVAENGMPIIDPATNMMETVAADSIKVDRRVDIIEDCMSRSDTLYAHNLEHNSTVSVHLDDRFGHIVNLEVWVGDVEIAENNELRKVRAHMTLLELLQIIYFRFGDSQFPTYSVSAVEYLQEIRGMVDRGEIDDDKWYSF